MLAPRARLHRLHAKLHLRGPSLRAKPEAIQDRKAKLEGRSGHLISILAKPVVITLQLTSLAEEAEYHIN